MDTLHAGAIHKLPDSALPCQDGKLIPGIIPLASADTIPIRFIHEGTSVFVGALL
jgi:hypothetical protein